MQIRLQSSHLGHALHEQVPKSGHLLRNRDLCSTSIQWCHGWTKRGTSCSFGSGSTTRLRWTTRQLRRIASQLRCKVRAVNHHPACRVPRCTLHMVGSFPAKKEPIPNTAAGLALVGLQPWPLPSPSLLFGAKASSPQHMKEGALMSALRPAFRAKHP